MSVGLFAIHLPVSAQSIGNGFSVIPEQGMLTKRHGNAVGSYARSFTIAEMRTTNFM
jgi:hypothetical protein